MPPTWHEKLLTQMV